MQFFIPPPTYQQAVALNEPLTIEQLCERAQVRCRASGAWTLRMLEVVSGPTLRIVAEPGPWGNVRIEIPPQDAPNKYSLALNALAYGLHDLVARESIKGTAAGAVTPPRGRPRRGSPKSNRQRQRDFRRKVTTQQIQQL